LKQSQHGTAYAAKKFSTVLEAFHRVLDGHLLHHLHELHTTVDDLLCRLCTLHKHFGDLTSHLSQGETAPSIENLLLKPGRSGK
jgi:hypothetical protein